MKHTTFQRATAAVCGALIAGSAFGQSSAAWGEQSGRPHERPRFFMYANLPFGDARAERPSFGLRFESAPLRAASLERIPYVDFQFQGQRNTLMLAGVPVRHAGDSSDSGDGPFGMSMDSFSNWSTPAKAAAATGAVLVVACATRIICKKHKSDNAYVPPTTGTGPGTGTGTGNGS